MNFTAMATATRGSCRWRKGEQAQARLTIAAESIFPRGFPVRLVSSTPFRHSSGERALLGRGPVLVLGVASRGGTRSQRSKSAADDANAHERDARPRAPVECADGGLHPLTPEAAARPATVRERADVPGEPGRALTIRACDLSHELRVCLESAANVGPAPEGTLSIALAIDGRGVVTSAKRPAGTIDEPSFVQCVEDVFVGERFPRPVWAT